MDYITFLKQRNYIQSKYLNNINKCAIVLLSPSPKIKKKFYFLYFKLIFLYNECLERRNVLLKKAISLVSPS